MVIKRKKITIRDVAKRAGVSYQTVSRVINGSESVAEKTRKRIVQAMHELDFSPNKAAQMLTTNRSHTLELVIVDVLHGGRLADSIKNMAHASKEAGYSLLVSETEKENLGRTFDNAASRLVDGIIMYAPRLRVSDDELSELAGGIPLVRRDYVPDSRLAWVGFDQIYATRLAIEYLLDLGHRQIAAIPPEATLLNGYWRNIIWKRVLLERGLQPGPAYEGDYTIHSGYEAANRIWEMQQPFTALLVGTDYMALGAIRALRERGLRIPDDISIVSFDNAEIAAYIEPALTTIGFKFAKQDSIAVKYLIDLLADPEIELHQRILMPDLIVRESAQTLKKS